MTRRKSEKNSVSNNSMKKPMLPEQQIKRSFQPLLSRIDDSARLTFIGWQHSISKNDNPFLKLIFACMDSTRKNPANIAILSNYRYSEMNKLGRTLAVMGFEKPKEDVEILDEEDEFGHQIIEIDWSEIILSFLSEKRGTVWKAQLLSVEQTGLYRINIDTLQPFEKNGVQVSDFPPNNPPESMRLQIDMIDTVD